MKPFPYFNCVCIIPVPCWPSHLNLRISKSLCTEPQHEGKLLPVNEAIPILHVNCGLDLHLHKF